MNNKQQTTTKEMSEKRIKVVMTPNGTAWSATTEYRLLDYISNGLEMWLCVKTDATTGVNVGHKLTETDWWSKCVDMTDALGVAEQALQKAKDTDARLTEAEAARAKAESQRVTAETAREESCASAVGAANTAASAANTAATAANNAATSARSTADAAAAAAKKTAEDAAAKANTAASSANDAATAASRVNATITDGNVMEVTDRTGAKKTLSLVTPAQAAETAEKVDELETKVRTWLDTNAYVGFYRANGDASGDAEVAYGTAERMHEVGAEWKLATVKDGKVTHVMAPGRLTLDEDGKEVAIDGSEGDVMLINRNCHLLKDTKTIDGRELNIIGIGNRSGRWFGTETKRLPPFGMTPCEAVYGKIFDDAREQAHCVYNTDLKSQASTPIGLFVKSYKADGGGYFPGYISAVRSIQMAQAKNEDALTARPYMGWYYETYEALLATMFGELGSLSHTRPESLGVGCTSSDFASANYNDAQISGTSGWRIVATDGTVVNSSILTQTRRDNANVYIMDGVCGNGRYQFVEMLEGQRILDGIAKAGLVDMMGDKSHVFCYTEDGSVECIVDGSVDLDTGEGMEECKFYYLVRDVPGCEGMGDGVMTAVVNRYVRMTMTDGVTTTDGKTDLSGATALMKVSLPIYRGFALPLAGVLRQMGYAHHMLVGTKADYTTYYCRTPRMEDVQPLTDFSANAYQIYGETEEPLLVRGMKKTAAPNFYGEAWIRKARYDPSLFCVTATGASMRTYENAYLWMYARNYMEDEKYKHFVTGSVVGCRAVYGRASARASACSAPAGSGSDVYAGAFAVLLNQ